MSAILFDAPGPKARLRHRIYTTVFILFSLALAYWVVQRFRDEGVLTSEVLNSAFQNDNVNYLVDGLLATVKAATLAITTSMVFGAMFAVGRLSDHRLVRLPAVAVIEFFRAVPLALMMLILYFAFKDSLGALGAVVAALTLYNGAVLAEVFRAGVNVVAKGQSEAAYALGMRKTQVMTMILMPQAVKFMLPAIISQCVVILKDTSLGYLVVYGELVRNSRQVTLFVDNGTIVVYGAAAIVFIVINYSLSKLAQYLERRLAQRGRKAVDIIQIDSGVGGF